MKPGCPNCRTGSCKHIEESKTIELQEVVEAVADELDNIAGILERIVYRLEVLEEDTNALALHLNVLEKKYDRFFEEQGPTQWIVEYDLSDKNIQKLKDWINDETKNS